MPTVYHLTDNPRFKLDETFEPQDNSLSINPRDGRRGLYVGRPETWASPPYGYKRPYVAELEVPAKTTEGGRWGGENFIPAERFGDVKVTRVMPYDHYIRREYKSPGDTEDYLGKTYDTNEPLDTTTNKWLARYPKDFDVEKEIDTRYPQQWSDEDHRDYLAKRRDFLHDVHGWGWNEFNPEGSWRSPEDDEYDDGGELIRKDRSGQVMTRSKTADVNPIKSYLPWAEFEHGLTPEQSAFQRTHPTVRRQVLQWMSDMGQHEAMDSLLPIHRAQNKLDRIRYNEGRPSPYAHPSRAQPYLNPMDTTLRMPPVMVAVDEYSVHPDEVGYLKARDFYDEPLNTRPWEHSSQWPEFDARVQEIMDSAQHEGIREPVDVMAGRMHDGAHRWEAARRLGIDLPIRRHAVADPGEMHVAEYEGEVGNPDHITRSERGMLPLDWFRNMKGARGEVPGEHRNHQGEKWEAFKSALAEGKGSIAGPLFVTVDYGQQPVLAEGNHRRDAYAELGATHVPAEIRYFGHAERQGTVADRLSRRTAAAPDELGLKAAGIAVIALDTGRVLMQQRALNPLHCPCGLGVTWDPMNGYQHDDGSVSHDGEFYGRSVSDLLDQGYDDGEPSGEIDPDSIDPESDTGADQDFSKYNDLEGSDEAGFDKTAALEFDPNEGTWEFPGGKIDPGESPRDAAVREFKEEVGQPLPPGVFVGAWVSPGGITVTATSEPFKIPKPPVYRQPHDIDPRALDDEAAMHLYNSLQHEPYHPEVQDAYDALEQETLNQWNALKDAGLKVDFHDGFEGNRDYPNSAAMVADVHQGHLWTRHSALDGLSPDHPMARHMGFTVPVQTGSGVEYKPATLNDIFRAVHDVNGHASGLGHETVGFGPKGEYNAWIRHRTTYPDAALPALWNETRGQAAQLGPLTQQGVKLTEIPFLEQKAGLPPQHMAARLASDGMCVTPGRAADSMAHMAAIRTDDTEQMRRDLRTLRDPDPQAVGHGYNDPRVHTLNGNRYYEKSPAAITEPELGSYNEVMSSLVGRALGANVSKAIYSPRGGLRFDDKPSVFVQEEPGLTSLARPSELRDAINSVHGKRIGLFHTLLDIPDHMGANNNEKNSRGEPHSLDHEGAEGFYRPTNFRTTSPFAQQHFVHFDYPKTETSALNHNSNGKLIPNPLTRRDVQRGTEALQNLKPFFDKSSFPLGHQHVMARWADLAANASGREGEDILPEELPNFKLLTRRAAVDWRNPDPESWERWERQHPDGLPAHPMVGAGWPEESARMPSEQDVKTNVNQPFIKLKNDEVEDPWESADAMAKQWDAKDAPHPLHHMAAKAPVYKGFIYLIQRERDIDLGNREIANPDDPDGDMTEQSAWWEIDHAKKNPALRQECKKGTPWAELELWADKSVRENKQVQASFKRLAERDPYLTEWFSDEPKPAIKVPERDHPNWEDNLVRTRDPDHPRINPSGDALFEVKPMEDMGATEWYDFANGHPCEECYLRKGEAYPKPDEHFDRPGHTPMDMPKYVAARDPYLIPGFPEESEPAVVRKMHHPNQDLGLDRVVDPYFQTRTNPSGDPMFELKSDGAGEASNYFNQGMPCEKCWMDNGFTTPQPASHFELNPEHHPIKVYPHLAKAAAEKCMYCKSPATKTIVHSEGMAKIPVCSEHLAKGRADAAKSTPDGSHDPSNINSVKTASGFNYPGSDRPDNRPPLPPGLVYQDISESPYYRIGDEDFWRWRDPTLTPPFNEEEISRGFQVGDNESHRRRVDAQPMILPKEQSDYETPEAFDRSMGRTKMDVKWDEPICKNCYLRYGQTVPAGTHKWALDKLYNDLGQEKHEFEPMLPDTVNGKFKEAAVAEKPWWVVDL